MPGAGRVWVQVMAADDLQVVIRLYKGFVERFPLAKQAGEGRSTLAIFESMVGKDPVRFRGKWMPRAEATL